MADGPRPRHAVGMFNGAIGPEEHWRSIVRPDTVSGKPAASVE